MKVATIISGIAMAIGLFLVFCVAGTNDYYMEMGIAHPTNFILAAVGVALMVPFPIIINWKGNEHGSRKEF